MGQSNSTNEINKIDSHKIIDESDFYLLSIDKFYDKFKLIFPDENEQNINMYVLFTTYFIYDLCHLEKCIFTKYQYEQFIQTKNLRNNKIAVIRNCNSDSSKITITKKLSILLFICFALGKLDIISFLCLCENSYDYARKKCLIEILSLNCSNTIFIRYLLCILIFITSEINKQNKKEYIYY